MSPSESTLSLRECADRLGVHYMTVYRYVRTGMLRAHKEGATWVVESDDVVTFEQGVPDRPTRGSAPWDVRFREVAIRGDDVGAWRVIESALAGGKDAVDILTDVIVPSLRAVGELWASGEIGVGQEHLASGVATRALGRLGSHFRLPGRRKGTVVIGAPPGERHALPVSITADLFRASGWEAIDLGSDLPVPDLIDAADRAGPNAVVGIGVTMPENRPAARDAIERLRSAGGWTIVVGGAAVGESDRLGADLWARDGRAAAEALAD